MNSRNLKIAFFVFFFSFLALVFQNINFSKLLGTENQFFTLFQFFGPIAGAFLGPVFGAITVFLAQLGNMFLFGKSFDLLNILRLAPMIFAAMYFGAYKQQFSSKTSIVSVIIPLLAITAFVLHPVGSKVWFYSLFWLIPLIARFLPDKMVLGTFFRSLGATFTAHAVGGAIWVWSVPMPAEAWIALIPVVIYERILFASGITVSYIAFNAVLSKAVQKSPAINNVLRLEKRYSLN